MSVTPRRAAVMHAQETNENTESYTGKATIHYAEDSVEVVFTDGVPLNAEELIRDHGFKISPSSAKYEHVKLYKRIYPGE